MKHENEFEAFVRRSRPQLLGIATALTAGDTFLAEDLVQGTLVRMYIAWRRTSIENAEAYARRGLVNAFIDHRRRSWIRSERAYAAVPEAHVAHSGESSDHTRLIMALAELPPRMRAAVVLRYVEDLSVDQVAYELGCRSGTVKSQTARGVAKLREALERQHELTGPTSKGDPS